MFNKNHFAMPFFDAPTDNGGKPTGKEPDAPNDGDKGKTFTQEQLNEKIEERLARERKKYADYEELQKKAKELEELKKAKMTEEEKLRADLEAAMKSLADEQAKTKELEIASLKSRLCSEAGIDAKFASRVMGADEESIKADIEQLKAILPKGPVGGTGAPGNGGAADPTTEAKYAEAIKAGDLEAAMQLKKQLYDERK